MWLYGGAPPQVGTMMAEFPLDPQLAKMMVTAPEYRFVVQGTHYSN